MRFLYALSSLLAFATTVVSQSANLEAPANGTAVAAGSNFTVVIERPDNLNPSIEVAVVISLETCFSSGCPDPSVSLGTILYNGPFNPQFAVPPGTENLGPHENFTLTVPADFPLGNAELGVVHVSLFDLSETPVLETFGTVLVIT